MTRRPRARTSSVVRGTDGRYGLVIADQDGANARRIEIPDASFYFVPTWAPDGSKLAFTDTDYRVLLLDLETAGDRIEGVFDESRKPETVGEEVPVQRPGGAETGGRPQGAPIDPVEERKPPFDIPQLRLRIGAERAGAVGDPVAGLDVGDPFADGLDDAGTFGTRNVGELRRRIEARPVVGVDVVQPDGRVADAGLAGAGIADLDILPFEDFGPAGFMHANGFGHGSCLPAGEAAELF